MYITTTSPEPPGPDDIVVVIRTSVPAQDPNYYFTVPGYNANVTQDDALESYTVITENSEFSETGDVAVGWVVIVMCVVALLGNSLSVAYFWEQRRKTIYPLLYSFMSIHDIVSALVSIPVIVTLFTSRDPVMFGNGAFCLIWTVLFYYLLRISIFLVLLISVTRTMGMTLPMYKTKPRTVMLSLVVYSAIILIIDTVYLSTGMLRMRYRDKEAFCEMFVPENVQKYTTTTYLILIKLEIIVPSVLIIISFIVGTLALVRRIESCKKMQKDETQFRNASITVTLFTATYLVCYLPCFCLEVLYFISLFWDTRSIRGHNNFKYYAHLITVFLLPLLNSSLNPCMYLTRMPQYRTWSSRISIQGRKWTKLSSKSTTSV